MLCLATRQRLERLDFGKGWLCQIRYWQAALARKSVLKDFLANGVAGMIKADATICHMSPYPLLTYTACSRLTQFVSCQDVSGGGNIEVFELSSRTVIADNWDMSDHGSSGLHRYDGTRLRPDMGYL